MFLFRAGRFHGGLTFIFFLILTSANLHAERITGTRIPSSDFWERIHPYHTIRYPLPDTTAGRFYFGHFQLFRDPLKGWLLVGDGNGQVWTLNNDSCWEKNDTTICYGYNFGALVLPGPRKYGGYGYWRTTGMLITYDWALGEWTALRQSREIPVNYPAQNYYDDEDSLLYQLGSYVRNGMVENEVTSTDSLYVLDLKKLQWSVLGRINLQLLKVLGNQPGVLAASRGYPCSRGVLYFEGFTGYLIFIDFKNRTCTFLDNELSASLELLKRKPEEIVSTDYGLFVFQRPDFKIIDSISWETLLKNPERVMPLLEPEKTFSKNWLFWSVPGVLALVGFSFWWRGKGKSKSKSRKADQNSLPVEHEKDGLIREVKTLSNPQLVFMESGTIHFGGNEMHDFTNQEKQLLRLLVEKRRKNEELSTIEFNEALSIDHRTTDVQKKIRSEMVKSINRKFQEVGFSAEAVQRNRQDDDRRIVTYFLDSSILL